MSQSSLRIGFAGTPGFAAVALEALIASEHELLVVLTQPDRPAGRGRKMQASEVKQVAMAAELPVWQPENLNEQAVLEKLAALDLDVLVVVAYGLLLPKSVLDMPRLACLNIHASLLPRWRGAAPIQRAILAGDKQTGVCIMQMDVGLDTGDVYMQRELDISENTTAGELHDALATLGAEALMATLPGLADATLKAVAQVSEGACYAHKLKKQEALLDFSKSAYALHRQIMAFNPWPVAETRFQGQQLRVWRSELVPDESTPAHQPPGKVCEITGDGFTVATADGMLHLLQVQRPGKKPTPAADVARALKLEGEVLG